MCTNVDVIESCGPDIDPVMILQFLVKRCEEILQSEHPKFSMVMQALGVVGLSNLQKLLTEYKDILAEPSRSPEEVIRSAIQIFQMGLDQRPDDDSPELPKIEDGEDKEPDVKVYKQVMMQTLREGRRMLEEPGADYRFVRIFECLAWVALQCDPTRLAEFEAVRKSLADDPEHMLTAGIDILRESLFRGGATGHSVVVERSDD